MPSGQQFDSPQRWKGVGSTARPLRGAALAAALAYAVFLGALPARAMASHPTRDAHWLAAQVHPIGGSHTAVAALRAEPPAFRSAAGSHRGAAEQKPALHRAHRCRPSGSRKCRAAPARGAPRSFDDHASRRARGGRARRRRAERGRAFRGRAREQLAHRLRTASSRGGNRVEPSAPPARGRTHLDRHRAHLSAHAVTSLLHSPEGLLRADARCAALLAAPARRRRESQ